MSRPNILWYCTDQQRWDTIAALGNPHIHTPALDALCRRGTAFTRCYVQAPICTPSRASFLTGRYPASHHVHRNGNIRFPAKEVLVTRLLADAGYDCGLLGKLHLSAARELEIRPDDGYRMFQWSHHPAPDFPNGHAYADWLRDEKGVDPAELFGRVGGFLGAGVPAELHQTTWCSEMAIRFINEARGGRPWLLSVNPFDPHPPFDPPADYLARYDADALPPPLFGPADIERQRGFGAVDQQAREALDPTRRLAAASATLTPEERETLSYTAPNALDGRAIKAHYYAMISLIDDQFARILAELERTGQAENTITVFTSDHGELLGDHGLVYKGCRFFEGLVHVPLIIAWPGRFRQRVESPALVESIDLAPTLLQAAGLAVPADMQGRSLLPILTGEASAETHKPHVLCEYNDALNLPNASHGTMYFNGSYKLCLYQGTGIGELFDLATDPGEFDNLFDQPEHRALRDSLVLRHFDAYLASSDAGLPRQFEY